MSLHPQVIPSIPDETARVAHAIFPKGNVYMHMRDELGTIYQDQDFADLFPQRGQAAEAPWRLALVTVIQYAEGLTDRQAADAVRTRIDVKYALSLDLTDVGFDFSYAPSPGMCGRDDASCARCPSRSRSRLAPGTHGA
jgi:transposase